MTTPAVPAAFGGFEALVLMAVLHLAEREQPANGSAIRAEIEARLGRPVSRGSIYVTLDRLEDKRLLVSRAARPETPGRRPKRLFRVTPAGVRAARQSVAMLVTMHKGLEPILGDA
jgi:DNA-binding PadR family transcriptional regulator